MKLELKAPVDWSQVTLKQYKELLMLKYNEEEVLEYRIDQCNIFNPQYSKFDLMKMSMPQLKLYFDSIDFVNAQPVLRDCKEIDIEGVKYTFIEFKNMSLEQWIDCEKYSSIENSHKLIAIFYIEPEKYNDRELDKVSDWLLNAPVTEYFWSLSFFLFIHLAQGQAIKRFSEMVKKKREKTEKVIEISKRINEKLKSAQKWLGYKS
jgi:hypothetical protein